MKRILFILLVAPFFVKGQIIEQKQVRGLADTFAVKQRLLKYGADFSTNVDSIFLKGDFVNVKDFGAVDDNSTNNAAAFAAAVATGKPVFIPSGGIFRIGSTITFNTGQTIFGMGTRSQVRYTGTSRAFIIDDSCKMLNFHVIGNGKASGNPFESGVINNSQTTINFVIADMLFESFGGDSLANGGGGIILGSMAAANSEGASIINCRILNCKTGINLASRAEYVNITGVTISGCVAGISLGAGNFAIANCILEANDVNLKTYLGTNNGHGAITGCLINHATKYALQIENITPSLGISFTNCMIYYGALFFKVANNIRFVNCNFSALDSVHLDSTYDVTRSACIWGQTAVGGVIPINKFRGATDFEVIGETRFTPSTPNYWIKQQNGGDTVQFTGPLYSLGTPAASTSTADSFWLKDVNGQLHFRGQSQIGAPATPSVRSVGTAASGTGNITPGLPSGHATNDILLLFVESANESIAAPTGYTQIGPQNGAGTAAASGSTRLAVFWKRDGGSESAPTVTDAGNRTQGVIIAVSGCVTTGNPFFFMWNSYKTTASTSYTSKGNLTTINNMLIVYGLSQAISAANASQLSAVTNSSLTSLTTQYDNSTADGVGGGLGIITGVLSSQGSYGSLTATEGSSTADVSLSIAMIPDGAVSYKAPTEVYNYLTSTATDIFNVPPDAQWIKTFTTAGGGAGGAGIASTAAGGGGGGGGASEIKDFRCSDLTSPIQVTVGVGGVGGATKSLAGNSSIRDNNGSGNNLSVTTRGSIGSDATSGSGGNGGTSGSVNGLGTGATVATIAGGLAATGVTGGTTGAAGLAGEYGGGSGGGGKNASNTTGVGGQSIYGGGGGGGGGSATQGANGGIGGALQAGGTGAATGGNATGTGMWYTGGSGGGGGGTSAGGNGAQPGGAGGGGGGAANNGGNGAPGAVVIIVTR
jgi:hypothetical protein